MSATCASLQSRHHTQKFSHGQYLWGLKIDWNLWKQDLGCAVGSGSPSEFWDCFLCFQIYVWSCRSRISATFYEVELSWNTSARLHSLNVQVCVNGLTRWHNVYQNYSETRASLRSAWPFAEPARPGGQRLKVHLSTALTQHTFLNYFWLFSNDSFSATRNAIAARCLKRRSPFHDILANICAFTKKRTVSAALQ